MMRKSHQLIQLFQDLDLILLALGLQVFSQENFTPHMHLHQLKSRNSKEWSLPTRIYILSRINVSKLGQELLFIVSLMAIATMNGVV